MLYHVIRRSPHNNNNNTNKNNGINSPNNSTSSYKNGTIPLLMSRFHYSKVNTPHSATSSTESFFPRQQFNGQSTKSNMTNAAASMTTTSNNNNNPNLYSSFKSTFIPLVTNIRTMTPNKREFIQIPITREDGTLISNNAIRSVPITFISETTPLPTTTTTNYNNNSYNGSTTYSKPHYTSLLRPGSRYSRHHHHHSHSSGDESPITNISRLPPVPRRLSLTVPIMTSSSTGSKNDDETTKPTGSPPSIVRQIPIQFSQPSNAASIPSNSSRISSAVLRSSSLSHPTHSQLKRQKTDLGDISSSDFTSAPLSTSPVRRAEVMAREAIQGVVRFQQQQQQRNDSVTDNNTTNNLTSIRSPGLSRRVIVNLKNNQSVSLDSRQSSANNSLSRPPPTPSSARLSQRNNLYNIPILHEIQMPSHPATLAAEISSSLPQSPSISNRKTATNNNNNNDSSFKNEFRMEIPIQVITTAEQENSIQEKEDGIVDYDQPITIITERISSANGNSNQTLKSILKRSSSRDNVPRKNVSFMNA